MRNETQKWVLLAALAMPLIMLVAPCSALAAGRIEGRILNGTTNRPAAGQEVQLLAPAKAEIHQLAVTHTNADGRFVFKTPVIKPNSFFLVQAVHQGVNYHAPVRLGAVPQAQASFKIYDSTSAPPAFHVTSARFVVRAEGDKVRVEELYALRNTATPPVSYVDPGGTFKFNLGKDAGQPSVAVAGEMNMPLPQDAQPGKAPGQFSIQYPLKPGLTVVMVEYESDYGAGVFHLTDSIPYAIDELELDVVPASMTVKSQLFRSVGTDADTSGEKFTASNLAAGDVIKASFSGAALPASGTASSDSGGETVKEVANPMTRLGAPLLGCFLLVLLWAMGMRVSREWARKDVARPGSPAEKELETKIEKLLDSVANLDELFEGRKIPEKRYWRERLDLKAKLVVLLKTSPPAFIESYATRHKPR
ncbi:MAG: hypothetical protein KGM47_01910 [Acidobacteriota bacterium]|nr:hypothetical protein [Acidobacteriota bacterium]